MSETTNRATKPLTPQERREFARRSVRPLTAEPSKWQRTITEHNRRTLETALQCADRGLPIVEVHSFDERGPRSPDAEGGDGGTGCGCEWSKWKDKEKKGKAFTACVSPGKHPIGAAWQTNATTDRDQIMARWRDAKFRRFNVGLVFGSASCVVLVEADGADGRNSFNAMAQAAELPDTVTVVSGSGGYHCLFRVPPGWNIRNSQKTIALGVDVRGENGFSVAPGSLHKSGNLYRWYDGFSPDDVPIADMPIPLLRKCFFATKGNRTLTAPDGSTFAQAGLDAALLANADALAGADAAPDTKGKEAHAELDASDPIEAGLAAAIKDMGGKFVPYEKCGSVFGHGEGREGFHGPIYRVPCIYFVQRGYDAPSEPLKAQIIEWINVGPLAPDDPANYRDGYLTDDVLDGEIERARQWAKARPDAEPDRSYRARTDTSSAPTPDGYASIDDMNAAIDALTPETDDIDLKAIMRAMCASHALGDAAERMGVRRIAHRVSTREEFELRDMAYVKAMWAAMSWHTRNPMPPAVSEAATVAAYMSRRYAGIRWGRDFAYVDVLQPQITPYAAGSLKEEYRRTAVLVQTPDGPKKVSNWFTWWASVANIQQYEKPVFAPKGYVDDSELNLYRGDALKAIRGDWSLFRQHLFHNVCDGNPYKFMFLICTLAAWVQAPQKKMGVAIVLRGVKGCGKTKVGEWVCELFPYNNAVVSNPQEMFSDFNVLLAYAIVVVGNEAFWAGSKSDEGTLKAMITDGTQNAHPKGMDRVKIADCRHFIFTSNEDWVVPATEGERRFLVLDVNPRCARNRDYFAAIDEQMEAGGLEAMRYDLLNVVIPDWIDLRNPPETTALREQITHSQTGYDAVWQEILASGQIELPDSDDAFAKAGSVTLTETFEWPLDKGVSVNRKRLREALERRAKRLHARVKSDGEFGIWLKKLAGGKVNSRNAETRKEYDLPPRADAMQLAGIDPDDGNDKMLGEHRLNAPEGADAGQVERLQRVHRALGYDGTVTIPDKVPLHVLAAWGLWGRGIDVQRGRGSHQPP